VAERRKAMRSVASIARLRVAASAAVALLVAAVLLSLVLWRRREAKLTPARFPEELVYVRAKDGIHNGGVIFTPAADAARPIAIIWIHGWGANFYQPTYVNIGRALAERHHACISANTRMHDLGNVEWIPTLTGDKRVRGGGYWGVASEQARDVAAWIDLAGDRGYGEVVLVGHSAGWAAVTRYQAEEQDRRVVGVVVASGSVSAGTGPTDPDQIAQATRMVAEGHPR
jgi:pimeloyl-ACP methyl ester carboxylesterase